MLALIACAVVFLLKAGPKTTQEESAAAKPAATERAAAKPAAPSPRSTPTAAEKEPRVASAAKTADPADAADTDEPETEEDREEKLVNAFDDLTDRWQDPAPGKVTMEEINRFREQFNKVPKDRKDECIHRALNLIPDENVMLLAGIADWMVFLLLRLVRKGMIFTSGAVSLIRGISWCCIAAGILFAVLAFFFVICGAVAFSGNIGLVPVYSYPGATQMHSFVDRCGGMSAVYITSGSSNFFREMPDFTHYEKVLILEKEEIPLLTDGTMLEGLDEPLNSGRVSGCAIKVIKSRFQVNARGQLDAIPLQQPKKLIEEAKHSALLVRRTVTDDTAQISPLHFNLKPIMPMRGDVLAIGKEALFEQHHVAGELRKLLLTDKHACQHEDGLAQGVCLIECPSIARFVNIANLHFRFSLP